MSIGTDDVIFHPAVLSDYCLVVSATTDGRKNFAVIVVKEGNPFPKTVSEDDLFLEVMNLTGGEPSVADIFATITEARDMTETYLPVRIRAELYGGSQEFFSELFSRVITSQIDDFPQSTCKH